MAILSWHENNVREDIPPEYLWEDDEGLKAHWEMVKERNDEKFGTKKGKRDQPMETVPMEQNDLARELRG